jgi:hypothetical protein
VRVDLDHPSQVSEGTGFTIGVVASLQDREGTATAGEIFAGLTAELDLPGAEVRPDGPRPLAPEGRAQWKAQPKPDIDHWEGQVRFSWKAERPISLVPSSVLPLQIDLKANPFKDIGEVALWITGIGGGVGVLYALVKWFLDLRESQRDERERRRREEEADKGIKGGGAGR